MEWHATAADKNDPAAASHRQASVVSAKTMSLPNPSIMDTRRHQMFPVLEPMEIERVRMSRDKLLLMETRYKLSKIAVMTGYGTASQFATAFKRHTGFTPGQFRKQTQLTS